MKCTDDVLNAVLDPCPVLITLLGSSNASARWKYGLKCPVNIAALELCKGSMAYIAGMADWN
jgi:hypothetical protein